MRVLDRLCRSVLNSKVLVNMRVFGNNDTTEKIRLFFVLDSTVNVEACDKY